MLERDDRVPPGAYVFRAEDPLPLTGERTSPGVIEENYWFQRHVVAYRFAAERVAGQRVLDAGCGEGYGTDILAEAAQSVVGVDLEAPVVRRAIERYPRVEFRAGDIASLPFPEASFDAVVSLQVIEHVGDPARFLQECARVLRPGGSLVLSTPNRLTFSKDGIRNPFHSFEFAPDELQSLVSQWFIDVSVSGTFHRGRLAFLDRVLRLPFPERLLSQPAPEWPRWLRRTVAAVRPDDFAIRSRRIESSLDLIAVAHRDASWTISMGLFAMVLHTHLPYVRRNGVWPVGEDFFHQAAVDSYLPLLSTLRRLGDAGLRDALTIGLSPMVVHQMNDPYMRRELEIYLGRYELRTIRQVANYSGEFAEEIRDLAAFYTLHGRRQAMLLDELSEGIAGGFGELQRAGVIEIIGGPASHPHLPLISEPTLLEAQIELGLAEHDRTFGSRPRGVWLPECAYSPEMAPPLEDLLAREGVTHFVVDGPTMIRSDGRYATFRPRFVGESHVAAFARNLDVTYRVWSPTGGYPGNKWYREFHRSDREAGFKNWRVTNKQSRNKRPYEPARAMERVPIDAADFVATIDAALETCSRETGEEGIIVACFDTELFGHWWFEGPAFVEHVYRQLAGHPRIRPVTLAGALEAMPPARRVRLEEGTWGFRKDNRSWLAPETEEMRATLSEAEADAVRLAAKIGTSTGGRGAAMDQLLRETFLLQASDWPFMVVRGGNASYARERFEKHLQRGRHLAGLLLDEAPEAVCAREARACYEIDNPFPELSAWRLIGERVAGS